jgi:hypothetical protein
MADCLSVFVIANSTLTLVAEQGRRGGFVSTPSTNDSGKVHVRSPGRFSVFGQPVNWIAADIVRIKDGVLAEHWDVIENEASRDQSKSGQPMFGDKFAG